PFLKAGLISDMQHKGGAYAKALSLGQTNTSVLLHDAIQTLIQSDKAAALCMVCHRVYIIYM
ncbi:hypothetical protein KIPB_017121, partial [Kipferlia bialata]